MAPPSPAASDLGGINQETSNTESSLVPSAEEVPMAQVVATKLAIIRRS